MPERILYKASDGALLSGYQFGDISKPCLYFSHSLGCTSEMWATEISILEKEFCCLAMDTRGHGISEATVGAYSLDRLALDVLETLDYKGVSKAHFCGLSLGGMIGQKLSVRAPQRFLSFVLAATTSYMGPPENWQQRIDLITSEGMEPIAASAPNKWFSSNGGASDFAVETSIGWILSTSTVGYSGCCAAIRDMDLRGVVELNQVTTLILAGNQDIATPPDNAKFLAEKIKNSTLILMDGGHLLNLEQPERFCQEMLAFYEKELLLEFK
ncbi:alpha/beta fold hydrolase [Hirschia litorea]|uniref:Alpha/beta fold hydrolase n=1 Tax=Hirschia litorea TaxID=1199156 RepID=A0ABW2IJS5_9PROT